MQLEIFDHSDIAPGNMIEESRERYASQKQTVLKKVVKGINYLQNP